MARSCSRLPDCMDTSAAWDDAPGCWRQRATAAARTCGSRDCNCCIIARGHLFTAWTETPRLRPETRPSMSLLKSRSRIDRFATCPAASHTQRALAGVAPQLLQLDIVRRSEFRGSRRRLGRARKSLPRQVATLLPREPEGCRARAHWHRGNHAGVRASARCQRALSNSPRRAPRLARAPKRRDPL